MNTQQILKTVSDAHLDLEKSIAYFAQGHLGAANAGKHIGMAKARLRILEGQLQEQVGYERARKQDTQGGYPK